MLAVTEQKDFHKPGPPPGLPFDNTKTLVVCRFLNAPDVSESVGRDHENLQLAQNGLFALLYEVKCVLPESIWNWPRGKVDSRSWDAAIDLVEQTLIEMAAAREITDEENRVLTAVFMECEELRANKYLEALQTNRAVAKKYAISPRTVTNWRKAGCPFGDGQWAVLDWMAQRRYAPAGAKAKFGKQLDERKDKAKWARISAEGHALMTEARQLKAAYQFDGLKPPDWLRGFRATPLAKFDVTAVTKTGQISNKD